MSIKPRQLGNYERYSLSRTLCGLAPTVTFHASIPASAASDKITPATVTTAIEHLLARYPILRCVITGTKTRTPSYQEQEVKPKEVLRAVEGGVKVGVADERLLEEATEDAATWDLETAPLWRVTLYTASKEEDKVRIVLAMNHTLSDGSGTRNIFAELLSLLHSPLATPSTVETTLPPSQESTIDHRPSTRHMLGVVFQELILPALPSFIRPTPSLSVFPNPPLCPPFEQPTALQVVRLPAATLVGLKTLCKLHNVTLHSLVQMSTLASFLLIVPDNSRPIVSDTPISIRTPSLGHPTATGNYVSSLPHSVPSPLPSPSSTRFFPLCNSFAAQLADPAERVKAKYALGMLAYIPDPELAPDATQTGWEKYIEEKRVKSNPWSSTFEVSNLVVLPATGWEDEGLSVCWAQPGFAFGAAFSLNVSTRIASTADARELWR